MHRPGQPPPLPPLHPLHGDSPPSFCCCGNELPAWQDACQQAQLVVVADTVGGGVLGGGPHEHECADPPLGGVATNWTVWCRRHGDDHLLQTVRKLRSTKVTGATLGRGVIVSAGRSKTGRQQTDEGGQNRHRHLKPLLHHHSFINIHSQFTESSLCTQLCENVPLDSVMLYCHVIGYLNVKNVEPHSSILIRSRLK